jgi:hypothetical protein
MIMSTKKLFASFILTLCVLFSNARDLYVGPERGDYASLNLALEWVKNNIDIEYEEPVNIYLRNQEDRVMDMQVLVEDFNYPNGINIEALDNASITSSTSTADDNYIIKIHNSSYITIKGFNFISNADYGTAILVTDDSNNLLITDNTFEGAEATNSNHIYHRLINLYKDMRPTGFVDITDVTITGNTFNKGGYHISAITGSSNMSRYRNLEFTHNTHNQGYYAITVAFANTVQIGYTEIKDVLGGIYLESCQGVEGMQKDIEIYYSRIYATNYGIYIKGCTGHTHNLSNIGTLKNIWCNEVIVDGPGEGTVALNVENSNNIMVVQNNLVSKSTHSNDLVFINSAVIFSGNNNKCYANNIIHNALGVALRIPDLDSTSETRLDIRYNNIYSNSHFLVKVGAIGIRTINEFTRHYFSDHLAFSAYDSIVNYSARMIFNDNPNWPTYYPSPFLDNRGYPNANWEFGISGALSPSMNGFGSHAGADLRCDIGCYAYTLSEPALPMNGEYSVGQGADYTTLSEAFNDLSARGINDSIVLILTDEVYDEKVEVFTIPFDGIRYGRTRGITVKSATENSPIIRLSSPQENDNAVVTIRNTEYIIFDNITFEVAEQQNLNAFRFEGANYTTQFINCTFSAADNTADLVYAAERKYLNEIEFKNSTFNNGAKAIFLYGRDDYSRNNDISITECTFLNPITAIEINGSYKVFIKNNTIQGYSTYGIIFNGNEYFEIENNIIESIETGQNVSNAMNLANSAGFIKSSDRYGSNLVANNIINAHLGGGVIFSGNYLDFLYNTVSSNGTAFSQYYQTENTNIENNIFTSVIGYALDVTHRIAADSTYKMFGNVFYTEKMNANSFYRTNYYFVKIINPFRDIYEFRDWQKEHNNIDDFSSICANPFLYETEDGLLIPQSSVVSKIGLRAGNRISKDIYGNERRLLPQTPGAVQTDLHNQGMPSEVIVGEGGYETIQDALYEVASRGINKDCTIKIEGGDYSESELVLHTIPILADLTDIDNYNKTRYRLIIEPKDGETVNIINSSTDNKSVFILNNADYVAIRNINFINNPNTGSSLGLIDFINVCDNVTIDSCSFDLICTNTTAVGIRGVDSNISRKWSFTNNRFENNGTGILIEGASTYIDSTTIANNYFSNVSNSISTQRLQNSLITKNEVRNGKVNLSYLFNTNITLNRVLTSGYSGSYDSHNIFTISSSNNINVFTNIVKVTNSNVRSLSALSILNNCSNINIINNTLSVEQNYDVGTGKALSIQGTTEATVVNNILSAEGFGVAIYKGGPNDFAEIRNNCYYVDGARFAYVDAVTYSDFIDYSAATGNTYDDNGTGDELLLDFHSFIAYPFLDDEGYSRSAYIIGKGKNLGDVALETIYKTDAPDDRRFWDEELENRSIGATYSYYEGENTSPIVQDITVGVEYETLSDALTDLMKRGVKDNHINLNIPSGTYSDNYHIRAIPGNNYFGLLILNGDENDAPIFNYNAEISDSNYIFKVSEPNGITFQNLKLMPQGSTYTRVFDFFGRNNGAKIYDCSFEAPSVTYFTNYKDNTFINSSTTYASHNTKLRIVDCSFKGNEAAVVVGTIHNMSSFENDEFEFLNNSVEDSYNGLYLRGMGKMNITNNKILNASNYAISVAKYKSYYTYINNNELSSNNNCLHLEYNHDEYTTSVYNNVFNLLGDRQANALQTSYVNKLHIDHNTILVSNTNINSIAFNIFDCEEMKCRNNIFYTDNNSYLFKTNNTANLVDIDYNIFHSNAEYSVAWGSMNIATQTELESTGMRNSLLVDPNLDIQNHGFLFEDSPALMSGIGLTSVSKDILGRDRHAETPSIGAYELADAIVQIQSIASASGEEGENIILFTLTTGTFIHSLSTEMPENWTIGGEDGQYLGEIISIEIVDSANAKITVTNEIERGRSYTIQPNVEVMAVGYLQPEAVAVEVSYEDQISEASAIANEGSREIVYTLQTGMFASTEISALAENWTIGGQDGQDLGAIVSVSINDLSIATITVTNEIERGRSYTIQPNAEVMAVGYLQPEAVAVEVSFEDQISEATALGNEGSSEIAYVLEIGNFASSEISELIENWTIGGQDGQDLGEIISVSITDLSVAIITVSGELEINSHYTIQPNAEVMGRGYAQPEAAIVTVVSEIQISEATAVGNEGSSEIAYVLEIGNFASSEISELVENWTIGGQDGQDLGEIISVSITDDLSVAIITVSGELEINSHYTIQPNADVMGRGYAQPEVAIVTVVSEIQISEATAVGNEGSSEIAYVLEVGSFAPSEISELVENWTIGGQDGQDLGEIISVSITDLSVAIITVSGELEINSHYTIQPNAEVMGRGYAQPEAAIVTVVSEIQISEATAVGNEGSSEIAYVLEIGNFASTEISELVENWTIGGQDGQDLGEIISVSITDLSVAIITVSGELERNSHYTIQPNADVMGRGYAQPEAAIVTVVSEIQISEATALGNEGSSEIAYVLEIGNFASTEISELVENWTIGGQDGQDLGEIISVSITDLSVAIITVSGELERNSHYTILPNADVMGRGYAQPEAAIVKVVSEIQISEATALGNEGSSEIAYVLEVGSFASSEISELVENWTIGGQDGHDLGEIISVSITDLSVAIITVSGELERNSHYTIQPNADVMGRGYAQPEAAIVTVVSEIQISEATALGNEGSSEIAYVLEIGNFASTEISELAENWTIGGQDGQDLGEIISVSITDLSVAIITVSGELERNSHYTILPNADVMGRGYAQPEAAIVTVVSEIQISEATALGNEGSSEIAYVLEIGNFASTEISELAENWTIGGQDLGEIISVSITDLSVAIITVSGELERNSHYTILPNADVMGRGYAQPEAAIVTVVSEIQISEATALGNEGSSEIAYVLEIGNFASSEISELVENWTIGGQDGQDLGEIISVSITDLSVAIITVSGELERNSHYTIQPNADVMGRGYTQPEAAIVTVNERASATVSIIEGTTDILYRLVQGSFISIEVAEQIDNWIIETFDGEDISDLFTLVIQDSATAIISLNREIELTNGFTIQPSQIIVDGIYGLPDAITINSLGSSNGETGIIENSGDSNDENIFAFPNPCYNYIELQLPKGHYGIRIVDVKGIVVYSDTEIEELRINTMYLSSGTYYLEVFDNNHVTQYSFQFVKK